MGRYIFLDRDGTINRELPNYVKTWEEFEFLPDVLDAFRLWRSEGFKCFVVSNQSCVDRKIASEQAVVDVMNKMCAAVEAAGGRIEKAYFCPHAPEVTKCDCRKPSPALFQQAAAEFGFDVSRAYSIGDMERDIQAGADLGQKTILVRTGKAVNCDPEEWKARPDYVVDDLLAAAGLTVELEKRN